MPEKDIYQIVVSQLATRVPLFAKAIVTEGLRRAGATPYDVTVVQMLQAVREYVQPRLNSFLKQDESLESTRTGVVRADATDRITYVSRAARRLLGLPGRLQDKDRDVVFRRARDLGLTRSVRDLEDAEGEIVFSEIQIPPPGGGTFHVTHWLERDSAAEAMSVISVFQDVSLMTEVVAEVGRIHALLELHTQDLEALVEERTADLRRSEQDTREIFEAAADGFFTCDPDLSTFQSCNRAFAGICGQGLTHIEGAPCSRLLRTEELRERLQEEPSVSGETVLRRANGEERRLALTLTRLPRQDQVLGVARDVTEQRLMESRLAHLERVRTMGEMAAGVAHDFNNILSIILGYAQYLLREETDPARREDLQTIIRTSQDGAQTVRRLQEFTRVRQDREFYPLDLGQVLLDAISLTRPRWKDGAQAVGKQIRVVRSLENVPWVEGNASELREVFFNLIGNAVEAIPREGEIRVSLRQEGDEVVAEVADDGVGMTPEVCRRALEPFFTTKGVQGHGLGLSMCAGIVTRHRGKIGLESEPGKGTCVRTSFPVPSETTDWKAPVPAEAPFPERIRVLLVDDEEGIVEVARRILEGRRATVVACAGGQEALQWLAQANTCDVVVTDLGMPDLSGWDVLKAVRASRPDVAVLLLTGWGLQIPLEEARSRGADGVLAKPFLDQDLLRAIVDAMDRRRRPPPPDFGEMTE